MDATSKQCSRCRTEKPLSEFGVDRQKRDGIRSWCRSCVREKSKEYNATDRGKEVARAAMERYRKTPKFKALVWRANHSEPHRRSVKKYYSSAHGRESNRQNIARWRARNPKAAAAHAAVRAAIGRGDLPRQCDVKCSHCPNQAAEYHHHNGYEKEHWLDVVPVCCACHDAIHSPEPPPLCP